jgi:hypothetical protein
MVDLYPTIYDQSDIDAAQADIDSANYELGEAQKAVDAIVAACVCIDDLFGTLTTFLIPGLGCGAACLVILVLNCIACCALGCCGSPTKKDEDTEMTVVKGPPSVGV